MYHSTLGSRVVKKRERTGGVPVLCSWSSCDSVQCAGCIFVRHTPEQCQLGEGSNPGANLKLNSHRCYLWEVAFGWELAKNASIRPWVAFRVDNEERRHLRSASSESAARNARRWSASRAASERRGDTLQYVELFNLKDTATIWP